MIDLKETIKDVIKIAEEAGELLVKEQDKCVVEGTKEDEQDIFTNCDLMVEKLIIDKIKTIFPDHGINSEECGDVGSSSDYKWIIDPIDGTKYYQKGAPLFAVSIGLQYKEKLVLGVVYAPILKSMYHAYDGGGAFLNGKQIKMRLKKDIKDCVIALDTQKISKKEDLDVFNRIITGFYRVRVFGVGSLMLCFLAQGVFDVFFDVMGTEKPSDIAGGMVIAREAGAVIYDAGGNEIFKPILQPVVSHPELKEQVLGVLGFGV